MMQYHNTVYTSSGVRLRQLASRPGRHNWLLLPGGPGLGSESLLELGQWMAVDGSVWLVDLPGDGNNGPAVPSADEVYGLWPEVLLEAAQALPHCVLVGHSTGGMYSLSVPALAPWLAGLVLISAAPDARWQAGFARTTERYPLPEVAQALQIFARTASHDTLKQVVLASAPWSFPAGSVDRGRTMLAGLPFNVAAMAWSDRHFDRDYRARWWPDNCPVLIISGGEDLIVDQSLWNEPCYQGANVRQQVIAGAGHYPWFDDPQAVVEALLDFQSALLQGGQPG